MPLHVSDPSNPEPPRYRLKDWPRGWAPDAFLLLLVPIVCALAALRLDERLTFGPSWDTYAFLDNAADMAGKSIGYVEPHRPPMLSFLTSLLIRAGAWNVSTIQILDVVLTVLGVIAFYLLLRRRFERPLAMVASVLLIIVPASWTWLGSGYTDFPSVAFSIWALLLVVKATEDDPKWYLVALPMVLVAILTRFGAFLMIAPVVLWLALRARPFQHAKQIVMGLGLTALAYIPAGVYYNKYFSDPFYPFSFVGGVAEVGLAGPARVGPQPTGLAAMPGWYYAKHVMQLLFKSPTGYAGTLFLTVTVIGLVVAVATALLRQRSVWRSLAPIAAVALIVVVEVMKGGGVVRVAVITLLGLVIGMFLLPQEKIAAPPMSGSRGWRHKLDSSGALALDATVLIWGLLFFDAHGHMRPEIDRYFITMAPAALYFVAMGWRALGVPISVVTRIGRDGFAARPDPASRVASLVGVFALSVVAVLGASAIVGHFSPTLHNARDPIVLGAEKSAAWLLAHDSRVRDKTVYSDVWPLTSWYLGQEAFPMPTFESPKAFPHELEKNRVDYFVTIRNHSYAGYQPVYHAGSETVLKYQSTFPRALPAVAYIGDGWDAYVEQLCNFDFNLFFSDRHQIGTGTWMLDGMSAQQLAQYDAVAVFGAHWRSKAAAEKTLRTYVDNGGVVIIDASRNMDGFSYPLVDTVFMDVLVRRAKVAPSIVMTVSPDLAEQSRIATSFAPAPFVDEKGGPWYGANYHAAQWARASGQETESYEAVASIGSQPAILLERLGKGRIYWVSNNLMWHAYFEGNESEVRLVRGLFREAVGLPPIPEAEVAANVKPWFISRKLRRAWAAAHPKPSLASTGAVVPATASSVTVSASTPTPR